MFYHRLVLPETYEEKYGGTATRIRNGWRHRYSIAQYARRH